MTNVLKVTLSVIISFFLWNLPGYAQVQEPINDYDQADHLLSELDVSDLETFWSEIGKDYQDYFPQIERISLKELITNANQLSLIDWVSALINIIGYELFLNGKLLGQLIIIAIISALIKNLQSSFQSESVTIVANFVLMILLTTLAVQSFSVISELMTTTITRMHDFIIALLPLLLSLMAMLGGIISASFFHPLIITFLYLIVILVDKFILVLIFLSLILHLVSQMNQKFQLTKLADLLRQIGLTLLFISLTIFLTVLSTQGAISAVQDGLGIKTAKFVTNNFVPVVGRMLSEATDTIFATTQVLKNGLGLFGLIFILLIVSLPIVKVAIVGSFFKLAAAIVQPIGDDQVVKSISIIADHVFYLLAVLIVVSFMFIMMIVVLLIASNLTFMIR
ncbi:stage III sporulation protein AE [Amphibacillus indicireducens]|uniref:Stage III sporulation protein AE n=1 Tax=Amphibacillus indicireducens TaxID=1076330 RepID=A0ABP7VF27_9BACI